MSNRTAVLLSALSMLAAIAVGLLLWSWLVSFDHPRVVGRPHWLAWDIVSYSLRHDGEATLGNVSTQDRYPILRYGAWFFRHCGRDARAIAAAQLPFMALLLLSVGFAAWRIAGPLAGGIAPWIALFAPMTLGVTTQMDDILVLQAFVMLTMMMLFWSDRTRRRWLAIVAAVVFTSGVRWRIWYSSEVCAFFVLYSGIGAWLLWSWAAWLRERRLLVVLLTVLLGPGFNFRYFAAQNYRPLLLGKSLWNAPAALWQTPAVWLHSFLRPVMGLVLAPAAFWAWRYSRRHDLLMFLGGCILLPTLSLVLINKRQEFYLATAVPSAYVLIAVGLAEAARRRRRVAIVSLLLLAVGGGWFWEARDRGRPPENYELPDYYLEAFEHKPTLYLISPRAPGDKWEIVGKQVAHECTARGLPPVFVEKYPGNGPVAFYAWQSYPRSRFGDVYQGPLPDPPLCLVFLTFHSRSVTEVLDYQRLLLRTEEKKLAREALTRVEKVERYKSSCAFAADLEGWSIYRCIPPAPPSENRR
jgi:hypothetical protein